MAAWILFVTFNRIICSTPSRAQPRASYSTAQNCATTSRRRRRTVLPRPIRGRWTRNTSLRAAVRFSDYGRGKNERSDDNRVGCADLVQTDRNHKNPDSRNRRWRPRACRNLLGAAVQSIRNAPYAADVQCPSENHLLALAITLAFLQQRAQAHSSRCVRNHQLRIDVVQVLRLPKEHYDDPDSRIERLISCATRLAFAVD